MGGGMRMTSPPMAIACSLPSIPARSSAIVPCLEGPVVGRARASHELFSGRRLVSFRILYVNWKLYVDHVESWLRFLSEPVGQSNHLA